MRCSTEPSSFAINTIGLFFVKSPFSTTPTILLISSSIFGTSIGFCHKQSKIWFPLSVITGPHFFTPSRKTQSAPKAFNAFTTGILAAPIISTGTLKPVPIV